MPPSVTSAVAALRGSPTLELIATRAAGASLTWDASALPRLVQWEIANVAGHYAVGIEPSTASRQSGGPNPVSNPGARPVPALGVTIELLEGAAGANLLDPEAS
jgi:hypothetical protein